MLGVCRDDIWGEFWDIFGRLFVGCLESVREGLLSLPKPVKTI